MKKGVLGVELTRRYAEQLRLIVLDIKMDLMDGTLAAAQIRQLVPRVPIMPFTSHPESLPALVEMGCVLPTVKRPAVMAQVPERMQRAMALPVASLPDHGWVRAPLLASPRRRYPNLPHPQRVPHGTTQNTEPQ